MGWLTTRLRQQDGGARFAYAGYGVTVITLAVATALLAPFRTELGVPTVELLFLVIVVLIAARWGWGPGLFASIAANLTVNFFFVDPLYVFTVQEPHNLLSLFVFLGVAALTSWLLARARAGEADARRREQETAILYDLSRLIIVGTDTAGTLVQLCARVRDAFAVDACAVLLPRDGRLTVAAAAGSVDLSSWTAYERNAAKEALSGTAATFLGGSVGRRRPRIIGMARGRDRPAPMAFIPLRIGGDSVGLLQLAGELRPRVFTADEQRLLEAFADEAALAVDRDRLLQEAAQAEALKEADRLKSALLSAVSHDLRTPLTSILTAVTSLLAEDLEWDAEARREFLMSIEGQTLRLSRLVSNLLDLSRIEGGALRPDKDWYDVHAMLEDVIESVSRTVKAHHVTLDVAPDVGGAPFDHVQISQVVSNLIENAAKFAPEGTEIAVAARRHNDEVEISVSDHGPGIPAEAREHIFEKFYRLSRNTRVPGTGLGLAISKGLVEAHGGGIRAEEAHGGGARFVFTLPAAPYWSQESERIGEAAR